MKFDRVAGVGLVVTLGLLYLVYRHDRAGPELNDHDSLVAERPHIDSVIAEHADSGRERIKLVYVQQDRSRELATIARQQDSLAQIAIQAHDFELAYAHEKTRGDTLAVALRVEKQATENALAASAFFQLAYLADSTELARTRRDADALAHALRVERRPKCGPRCGAALGIGFTVAAAWGVRQVAGR